MAWDTERTRTLLLDAATAEFSAHGFAGARIDRIATAAGVNKERIYPYFGGKLGLFDAVLDRALDGFLAGATLTGTGPTALAAYAGDLFDEYHRNPHLPRLLAWEGLELGPAASGSANRSTHCAAVIARVVGAHPGVDTDRAAELLMSIIALVNSWWALPQLPQMLGVADAARANTARRRTLVHQVFILAAAPCPEQ